MSEILQVLRIPEGDIVVTRKVPMTDKTCTELREIKTQREHYYSKEMEGSVRLELPTLLADLIHEEHVRMCTCIRS